MFICLDQIYHEVGVFFGTYIMVIEDLKVKLDIEKFALLELTATEA